jgi:hypothetical protein
VDEVAYLLLVEVLHDGADLRHDVQLGREADSLSILDQILP